MENYTKQESEGDVSKKVADVAFNANVKVDSEIDKNYLLSYSQVYREAIKYKNELSLDSPILLEIVERIRVLTTILDARLQTAHFTINSLISMFRAKVHKREYDENKKLIFEKKSIQTGRNIHIGMSNFIGEKMTDAEKQFFGVETRKLSHILCMGCHLHTVLMKFLFSLGPDDTNEVMTNVIIDNKTIHNIFGTLNIISPSEELSSVENLNTANKHCMEKECVTIEMLVEKIKSFRQAFETKLKAHEVISTTSTSQRVNDFVTLVNLIRYLVIDNLYVYFSKIQLELETKGDLVHKKSIELQ